MTRVAINRLGRIGRALFKLILDEQELELVAVNDLVPVDNLAYLLKYDTVYGRKAYKLVSAGDIVVITAGLPLALKGVTNLIKVHRIGEPVDPCCAPIQNLHARKF